MVAENTLHVRGVPMEMKISRKEAKILKLQNDDLEKKLKEHCKAQYRAKFEPRFNKYRAFFLRCFYTSTIAVIVCRVTVVTCDFYSAEGIAADALYRVRHIDCRNLCISECICTD